MDAPTNIISQTPFASSLLIINIDDYGWTSSRDQAVANLYKKHCISSTSVLINGYNASKAIEDALALDLPMGLHINLTEGLPIRQDIANNTLLKQALWQRSPSEKETICEVFHGKWEFYEMIAEKRIKKEHIFKEIQAQVHKSSIRSFKSNIYIYI